jgi:hypothetical protein
MTWAAMSADLIHGEHRLTGKRTGNFSILGHLAPAEGHEPKDIEAIEPNSLDIGTGKFCSKNREIQKEREFSLL